MRPEVKRMILKRMDEDHGYTDSYSDNMQHGRHISDEEDMRDYADERRGMRSSNRRRRDRTDGHYFEEDDDDYAKALRLPRKVKHHWLHNLMNDDGTHGPKFTQDEVLSAANKMRLSYDDYSETDVYLVTNMLYSDLCTAFDSLVPPDKSVYYWVAAAKNWLEDNDSNLTGSEKIVSYYYNVVNG